ncbi:hypothetical protein [Pseudoruegeria sp. HB172150]|nr:hypothetical protein [Pseudoruegeria sp. HB172150]
MTVVTARALLPFHPVKKNGQLRLSYLPKAVYKTAKSMKAALVR